MLKSKKRILSILLTLVMVFSTMMPAFASVTLYLAQDNDGTVYEYDFAALKASYQNVVLGNPTGTELYTHYSSHLKNVKAVFDSTTNRYVDFDGMKAAYTQDVLNGTPKTMDQYAADTSIGAAALPATVKVVSVANGQVVTTDKSTVAAVTVSAITATNGTVDVTLSDVPATAPVAADFAFTSKIGTADATALTVGGFAWDATTKKASFTFTAIAAAADDQSVVVGVSYKSGTAVNAAAFTVAKLGTVSVSAITATNGTIEVTLSEAPATAPVAADFAFTSKIGTADAAALTVGGFAWDATTKKASFTFTAIAAAADDQSVVVGVSYKSGTAVNAAAFTVAKLGTVSVSAITATNGTIEVTLSEAPATDPVAADFAFTSKIGTADAAALTVGGFAWDAATKKASFTFTAIAAAAAEQSVVVGVSYKSGTAVNAAAFTVAAAPAALTVSSVSAINATTISVVLPTVPTTAPVIGDFTVLRDGVAVTPTAITKDTDDATDKTYKLTVPTMANSQGSLSVNGVSATITGSEYGYDFLAPSVVSVETLDNRKIKVNFSERMHANAAVVSNYFLAKSTVIGTDLLDAAGSSAALSSDKKSVTITTEATTGVLVPATYILRVTNTTSNVMDVKADAAQFVITNTELSFSPTTSQLTDMSGPILGSATYNSGTKVLALTFDETIDITPTTDFDLTKVTFGGVALGANETIALSSGTTYNVTLSTANASALPSGALTLSIAAGALKDNATTQNSNAVISDFAVTRTSPPVATSASYDESTNRLTINFDGAVKYTPVDWTKISVTVSGTTTTLATGTMKSTANGTSLIFELTDANASTIENAAGTATSGTIKLSADAVTSTGDVNNLLTNDVALSYTQDSGAPSISSVNYNTETNLLTITFSEKMNVTDASIDETKLAISDGTVTVTGEEAFYVLATTSSLTLPLDISLGTNKTGTLEDDTADVPDLDWSKAKLVVSTGHGLADLQGNALATNTYATGTSVTLTDLNRPTVTAAAAVDAKHIDVTFHDEKGVALDTTTAQTVSNYSIALNSNGTSPMTVTSASLLTNGRTVRLTLANAHTFAGTFKVTVANVTDKAGNAVSTTANNSATYTSVITLDETKPVVNTVVGTAVAGRNNDTIAVTFSEDVDSVSATTLSNYTVEAPVGTVLALNSDNCTLTYTANTATFTLLGINLQDTTGVKVSVGAGLVDKAGNAIDRSAAANYSQTDTLIVPDGAAPTVTSVIGSAGANNDTITVQFSEEVQKATAELAANFTFTSPAGTAINNSSTSRVYTYNDNGTPTNLADDTSSLVITYPAGTLAQGSTVRCVTAANGVVTLADLAGVVNAGAETDNGSVSDGVLPTITAVSGKTVTGALDEIYITYSEPVQSASAIAKANYTIESPTGTAINMGELDAADITYDAATRTVTIALDTDDADTNVYAGGANGWAAGDSDYSLTNNASIKVVASNVQDMAGNAIVAGSIASGLVNNASNDILTGAIASSIVTGGHSINFVWDEELAASSLAAADFTITTAGGDVYPVTSVSLDATDKVTVTINTSRAIAADEAGLLLKVATGGSFTDLAGNAITAIDADNSYAVSVFGDAAAYTLVGTRQAAVAAPATFIKNGTAKRISDMFQLTGGDTANSEGFLVDSVNLGITPTTAALSEFTNVKLMWSDDTNVGDADDVQVGSTLSTATATATFSGISKVIADNGLGYFYLIADVADTVETIDSILVGLNVGATAISETTGFAITSTGTHAGDAVAIDVTAPTINNTVTTASHATAIVATLNNTATTDRANVYKGTTALNTGIDVYGTTASTVNVTNTLSAGGTPTIVIHANNGTITVTLADASGVTATGSLKINLNQLTDAAGNVLVNDTTAANTVLTIVDGGATWTATLGAN